MLLDPRQELEPFEYPGAYDYWLRHQLSYWNHTKISLQEDVGDFRYKFNDKQRFVLGNTLKSFTQIELLVGNEYWSNKVARWFPKPEITLVSLEFAAREMIHTIAYSQVDTNLGIKDYSGFLQDPVVKSKLNSLIGLKGDTNEEKAVSLAVFSAFTEGVNLFSSFAILLNFSRFGMMRNLKKLINYSILDESEHSRFGCWLFKTFATEYNLYTPTLKQAVYDAARMAVKLEDDFLDRVFEQGDIEGITKHQVRSFIRIRANQKLNELGLKSNWKNTDNEAADEIDSWFTASTIGERDSDFFAGRSTGSYVKGGIDWTKIFDSTTGDLT